MISINHSTWIIQLACNFSPTTRYMVTKTNETLNNHCNIFIFFISQAMWYQTTSKCGQVGGYNYSQIALQHSSLFLLCSAKYHLWHNKFVGSPFHNNDVTHVKPGLFLEQLGFPIQFSCWSRHVSLSSLVLPWFYLSDFNPRHFLHQASSLALSERLCRVPTPKTALILGI